MVSFNRYKKHSFVANFRKGWRGDSEAHALAARGISTGRAKRISPFISSIPTIQEDIPSISTPIVEAPSETLKVSEGAEQQAQPVEGEPSLEREGALPLLTSGTPPEPKRLEDERHEYEW